MDQIDIRQVVVGGARVGLTGLTKVFETMRDQRPGSEDELAAGLVELAGRSNYIPPPAEDDYRRTLLREFKRFMGEEVSEERSGLEIRVFGAGCPRCDRLMAEVMALLADLEISADLDHVKDLNQIGRLGPVGVPALMINGKIFSAGRVPNRNEITKWLREV
ncbi:MAG: thioredoxin family protein [Candidatus Eisenbacteria bacterium]